MVVGLATIPQNTTLLTQSPSPASGGVVHLAETCRVMAQSRLAYYPTRVSDDALQALTTQQT